jgi:hypothetical protein
MMARAAFLSSGPPLTRATTWRFTHDPTDRRGGAVQVRHPGRLRRAARAAAQGHARQRRQRHPAAGRRRHQRHRVASREGIDGLLAWLRNDPRLVDIDHKESYCDEQPFYRTKVKLKKEIVTLGVPGVDPNQAVGTYVEPQDWNALISDPEVLLIDTRNDYEVAIGTEGRHRPEDHQFSEFPDYIKANFDPASTRRKAMFCTGGIRCEKASSYMLGEASKRSITSRAAS